MLRNTWHRLLILFLSLFQVSEPSGELCSRRQISLRDCSVDNCYRCIVSDLNDYSRIPINATALQLFFTSEAGLGPSSRLPLLPELREIDLFVSNAGQTPVIQSSYFSGCPRLDVLTFFHDTAAPIDVQLVSGSFAGLTSLTRLAVSGLGLRELPFGVFNDLRRLKILDLSQNRLTKIAKGTFGRQRQLNTLYLGRNRIVSLVNVSFEGLDSLRAIDLHQNEIRSLGSELGFLALRNLTQINLAENGMLQIDSYAFTGLRRLEKLYLEGNSLMELTPNVFNDLAQLRELDLRGNYLRTLPGSLFSYLRSLEILSLRENKLGKIVSDTFDGLKNLKIMDLGSNEIRTVEERGLEGLVSVKNLQLNDNKLRDLDLSEFISLRSLEKLNLRNNSLETLTLRTTDNIEALSPLHLDLSQNPWNCNCDIYWLVLWLQRMNLTRLLESTECHKPEALRNANLLSAYTNHTCPFPFPTKPPAVPASESYSPINDAASSHKTGLSREAEIGIVVGSVVFAVGVTVTVVSVVYTRLRRFGLWDRQRSESIDGLHRGKRTTRTQELSQQRRRLTTKNGSCRLATPVSINESGLSEPDRITDVETTILSETGSSNNLCKYPIRQCNL